MESRKQPIGFLVKQINNVFEKELNGRLRTIGVTSSQCAVLDYLFHSNKEAVNQRGENLRTVISLYYVEGLTMHQISQVLQVSDSRVSQMHKTAIQKLRKSVKEQLD